MNPIGDEHPAEIGQGFDPRRDVDTVAINVIAVDEGNSSVDAPFQARENVGSLLRVVGCCHLSGL